MRGEPEGPDGGDSPWPPGAHRAALALVVVGAALRLEAYLRCRNLWLDEAYLADNILSRSFGGLVRPLDHHQGAPLGFLWLTEAAVELLGGSEYALRLVPLLAGLASLPLFVAVARRFVGPGPGLLAVGLFAVAQPLVYFASELKPYSLDVALGLVILLVALRADERPESTRRLLALGLAGATAVWFSYPAAFVLGGAGATLLARAWLARRPRFLALVAVAAAAWLASFALQYALFLRHLGADPELATFWENLRAFPPRSAWPAVAWLARVLYRAPREVTALDTKPIVAILLGLGASGFVRSRRWDLLLFLVAPIVLVLAASAARLYPFYNRLVLFTAPAYLLLVARGIEGLGASPLRWRRVLAVVAAVTIAVVPIGKGIRDAFVRDTREEIEPVLEHVARSWRMGDTLYVHHRSVVPFRFYRDEAGLDPAIVPIRGADFPDDRQRGRDLRALVGRKRVWFLFGWTDDRKIYLGDLDRLGTRLEESRAPGASAYLYDLTGADRTTSR